MTVSNETSQQPLEHFWAILLAAGEGKRLRSFPAVAGSRPGAPKQFRLFDGHESMLRWTIRRAERIVAKSRIVTIVAREHRRWWQTELSDLAPGNVLIQPENKGTAAGILLPLLTILARDADARVLILPCDHYVDNETLLYNSLLNVGRAVDAMLHQVVLVGMTPAGESEDYGWIVPEDSTDGGFVRSVSTFMEKPSRTTVELLQSRGALINSMILAASGRVLLQLFAETVPELVALFARHDCTGQGKHIADSVLYGKLPSRDFSRDVLARVPKRLLVHAAPARCGWSDLGTPRRLSQFLGRNQSKVA